MTIREIATGLKFPEGPIAMPDGSVIVVEMARKALSRVLPDGRIQMIAELGGSPNGAAIGPDGRCYVCNSGGFRWHAREELILPGLAADDYSGGRIEAVDLATGNVEVLYRECNGVPLNGPNDLVFDGYGGFWFTDHGKVYKRRRDRGVVYYAKADGSLIKQAVFPSEGPNGIGLSADDATLYVAESPTGRVWAYDLAGPGEIKPHKGAIPWETGRLLIGLPGYNLLDSLALDSAGNVCVTSVPSRVAVVSPAGQLIEEVSFPDVFTTNLCFGGPDLRTAFVTLSSTGRLVAMDWPRPGLPLHYLNR